MRPRDERETRTNFDDVPVDSPLLDDPGAEVDPHPGVPVPITRGDFLIGLLFIVLLFLSVVVPTIWGAK